MHKAHVYLIHFQRAAYSREGKRAFFLFLRIISVKLIWTVVLIATIVVVIEKLIIIKDLP